jgi:translation initiation factor IF-3
MTTIILHFRYLNYLQGERPIIKEQNINSEIRSPKVQLISSDGKNLGIMDTRKALLEASRLNLDLVQIAFKDGTPICQILDYGKYKYEQHKKQMESKKKQPKNVIKEIRLTPRIEKHDVDIKIRKILEFMEDNCTVRVSMSFKGRENAHKDIGLKVIDAFRHIAGTHASELSSMGNQISLTLTKAN